MAKMTAPQRAAAQQAAKQRAAKAMARRAEEEGDDVEIVGNTTPVRLRDDLIRAVVRAEGQLQLAKGHLADPLATDDMEELELAETVAATNLLDANTALDESDSFDEATIDLDVAARRSVYGLQATTWPQLDVWMLADWRKERAKVFGEMVCCGHCGEVHFGGRMYNNFTVEPATPTGAKPPYALCNDVMSKYTMNSLRQWRVCTSCADARSRALRLRHIVSFNPTYLRLLIVPGVACLALQNLSLLDVSVSDEWNINVL